MGHYYSKNFFNPDLLKKNNNFIINNYGAICDFIRF